MWTLVWGSSLSEALKRFVAPAIEALTRPTSDSWSAGGGDVGSHRSIWSLCRRFPTNTGALRARGDALSLLAGLHESRALSGAGYSWCAHSTRAPGSLLAAAPPLWARVHVLLHNPKHSMSNWEIRICNISQTVNSLFVTSELRKYVNICWSTMLLKNRRIIETLKNQTGRLAL